MARRIRTPQARLRFPQSSNASLQGVRMTSTTGQSRDMNPTRDDFAALLSETLSEDNAFEGSVIKGIITAIEKDLAVIDVGLKMEGRVPLREFALPGKPADL